MATEPAVYTVSELPGILRVGRHTAAKIAREIGIRVSPRRLVVPKVALERYLAGELEKTKSGSE